MKNSGVTSPSLRAPMHAPSVVSAQEASPEAVDTGTCDTQVSDTDAGLEHNEQGCCVSRRAVMGSAILGATALGLAACGSSDPEDVPDPEGKGTAVMKAKDLDVGGQASVSAGETKLLVYRPSEKSVLAYSAICTHAGCEVSPASEERFHCPCHSSWFKATDGDAISGPANAPLPRFAAEIKGENVVVYADPES